MLVLHIYMHAVLIQHVYIEMNFSEIVLPLNSYIMLHYISQTH